MPDAEGAKTTEEDEEAEADGPHHGLLLAGEPDLEEDWVAEEREERADVGEGVEAVGGDAGVGDAEPLLHERSGGGEDEVRQADRDGEEEEDLPRGIAGDVGFPAVVGGDRQEREGEEQEAEVEGGLTAGLQERRGKVGVGVAAEEQGLEKQEAGGPDAGAPAEPRENVFADEGLDLEEEESTGENAEGEGEHEGGGWGGSARARDFVTEAGATERDTKRRKSARRAGRAVGSGKMRARSWAGWGAAFEPGRAIDRRRIARPAGRRAARRRAR